MDIVYPIGSMYFSATSTSPASTVGGTWSQIKGALIAATGGNGFASVNYGGNLKISINQMPTHAHDGKTEVNGTTKQNYSNAVSLSGYAWTNVFTGADYGEYKTEQTDSNKFNAMTNAVGGGQTSFLTTMDAMFGDGQHNCPLRGYSTIEGDVLPKKVGDVAWLLH